MVSLIRNYSLVFKGTSNVLEKSYLRLTREPDPSIIRPEAILKQSLELILNKWRNKQTSYDYVSDQLRSIRQVFSFLKKCSKIKSGFSCAKY